MGGKHQKKKTGRVLLFILFFLALGTLLFSGGMLLYETVIVPGRSHEAVNEYHALYSRPSDISRKPTPLPEPPESGGADPEILPEFLPLLEKNPDVAGWLTIPDTRVDHPVFWTPEDPNYYLRRDADGNSNKLGSFYLSEKSTLLPQARALVMYGHNMEDSDEAFGQLMKFKQLDFLREHPTLTFDTIYCRGDWKIIAVCRASVLGSDLADFYYYETDYPDPKDFREFIKNARTRSLYHIDDDVQDSDSLLVLSTCDYSFWGDRFVVIARRLREDETPETVSTERYEKNPVMVMPDTYYTLDYIQETKPDPEAVEAAYRAFYD